MKIPDDQQLVQIPNKLVCEYTVLYCTVRVFYMNSSMSSMTFTDLGSFRAISELVHVLPYSCLRSDLEAQDSGA